MLVGQGRELVREGRELVRNLFSQPHPLVHFLSDGHMRLPERLMQLLALEV